jgi:hypothetical protein
MSQSGPPPGKQGAVVVMAIAMVFAIGVLVGWFLAKGFG